MWPLPVFAVAVTPVGTVGGTQAGVAETWVELGEVHVVLLAVIT
jgi:hypothetical protein